ncbi:MAG: insulinase family protein [Deltaproteobacteria bacterium]|nr:insulinase family protein [Deltaproteobacteria bacterium]
MRIFKLLLFAFLFGQSYHEETKFIEEFFKKIEIHTLRNGLRLVLVNQTHSPTFAGVISVKVGSVDESDGKKGISHFLEHMAFKGTSEIGTTDFETEKKLLDRLWKLESKLLRLDISDNERQELKEIRRKLRELWRTEEFQAKLADLGGIDINATTSADFTKYFGRFPSEALVEWAELEVKRLTDLVPRQFFEERRVILEERAMRIENNPLGKMLEFFTFISYEKHPYRYPVIGYRKDLESLTPRDLLDFHSQFYFGKNMAVVLIGDISKKDLLRVISHFEKIPSNPRVPQVIQTSNIPQIETRFKNHREIVKNFGTKAILVGFKKNVYPAIEDLCASLIARLLFDDKYGLVYKNLVQIRQLIASITYSELPGVRYPNVILVYMPVLKDQSVQGVTKEFWHLIENELYSAVTPENIELFKGLILADVARIFENRLELAEWLSESVLLYNSPFEIQKIIEKFLKLDAGELNACARSIFRKENSLVLISEK